MVINKAHSLKRYYQGTHMVSSMTEGYTLKVSFVNHRSTYRNILVPKNSTFGDVGRAIRRFMDLDDSEGHLFAVVVGTDVVIIGPDKGNGLNEDGVPLSRYEGQTIGYIHDLAERHVISVRFLKDRPMKGEEPILLKGSGEAPVTHDDR